MRLASLPGFAVLVLVAVGLYRSHDLTWGGADLPDGTRYKVSPVGISHVLEPARTVSPTRNCRWSEPAAAGGLCAPVIGADLAFGGLRLVEPMVYLGAGLAVAASLLAMPGKNRRPRAGPYLTGAALIACLGAPALLGYSAPLAVQSLSGLRLGIGGTLGTLQLAVAAAVLGGFTLALIHRVEPAVSGKMLLMVVALALPFLAFFAMFPLPQGLGFLIPGLGAGFAAGTWSAGEPTSR